MNIVRLFAMGVGVVILLVIVEGFRRQMKGIPQRKVAVYIAGCAVGNFMMMYGFRELQSGRWTGVMWISAGLGITYIAVRELCQTEAWQERFKKARAIGKPLSFWMKTLLVVLFALLVVIILVVSGGNLPLIFP